MHFQMRKTICSFPLMKIETRRTEVSKMNTVIRVWRKDEIEKKGEEKKCMKEARGEEEEGWRRRRRRYTGSCCLLTDVFGVTLRSINTKQYEQQDPVYPVRVYFSPQYENE